MGTPHRGSDAASLGQTLANIATVTFKKPNIQLLEALKQNSQELQDLQEEVAAILSSFPVVSCFEQKPTKFRKGIFQKTIWVSNIPAVPE
jgi:flagellar basal body rod protein FlgG